VSGRRLVTSQSSHLSQMTEHSEPTVEADSPNVAMSFLAHCKADPERPFLTISGSFERRVLTFAEMRDMACAYNAHFRARDLARGSVLAIILTHGPELYGAFLGALMAGLVPTLMPFPTPKQDRQRYWQSHAELFRRSEIRAVLTYRELDEEIRRHLDLDCLSLTDDVDPRRRDEAVRFNELAVLQHSSGTTALKKGVMLTHKAILTQIDSYARFIGLTRQSRIVSWLPLYHDMGFVACFLAPMILGCEISHLDAFLWSARPTMLLDEIVAFGGEFIWLPNFAFNHIINNIRPTQSWDLSSVRAFINCSEPCKPASFERFAAQPQLHGLKASALQVCYAMAENVFAVTQTRMNETPRVLSITNASLREGGRAMLAEDGDSSAVRFLSCGRPISGVAVEIAEGAEPAAIGEILISGTSLYSGYYRRPEATAERLNNGWHRTGDIGFLWDGELYVAGRVDDLLNIRGKNIYAHEVEDAINALRIAIPGRVVAFSVPNDALGTHDLVVLCETPGGALEGGAKKQMREAVNAAFGVSLSRLGGVVPGTLIKTTSGKLSRNGNRDLFLGKEL